MQVVTVLFLTLFSCFTDCGNVFKMTLYQQYFGGKASQTVMIDTTKIDCAVAAFGFSADTDFSYDQTERKCYLGSTRTTASRPGQYGNTELWRTKRLGAPLQRLRSWCNNGQEWAIKTVQPSKYAELKSYKSNQKQGKLLLNLKNYCNFGIGFQQSLNYYSSFNKGKIMVIYLDVCRKKKLHVYYFPLAHTKSQHFIERIKKDVPVCNMFSTFWMKWQVGIKNKVSFGLGEMFGQNELYEVALNHSFPTKNIVLFNQVKDPLSFGVREINV